MNRIRALAIVVRSDLFGRRRATTLVLLVVFTLAAAAIVAGFESQSRAAAQWDATFEDANGAHVTVSSDDTATLATIAALPEVAQATHAYAALDNRPLATEAGGGGDVVLREVAGSDQPTVARPLLRSGRWVENGNEIVVERSFALGEDVDVGDTVTIDPGGVDEQFEVVGIALDLIDCFYPQCDPQPAWVDPDGFARVERGDTYSMVFLRLDDPAVTDTFVSELLATYPGVDVADWLDTRADALAISDFFGAFLSGFGVFVMIAAAVVVAGLMTTRVIARRRDIGLLKAVGFTPAQVTWTMLASNAFVAAVAVGLGWLLGSILSGPLQLRIGEVLDDQSGSFSPGRLVPTLLIVETIVFFATIVPSWRTGRMATTAALAPVAPRSGRAAAPVRLASRVGAKAVGRVGVAAVVTRPARTIFSVLALVLAAVAVVVTAGMDRNVQQVIDDPALAGDPYDLSISPTVAGGDEVVAAIEGTPGVSSWFSATERLAAVGDSGAFLVRALGGDVERAGYVIGSGRTIESADEAIAGYGLLDRLGVAIGDEITVEINREPVTVTLVGWYAESEDSGEILQIPLAALAAVEPEADSGTYLVRLDEGADANTILAALQNALGDGAVVVPNDPGSSSDIDAFQTAFTLVTLLVLLVAFANLASTILLAARERFHDFGVLRSIGFTPRQVIAVMATAAGVIGAVGVLVGIPVGLVFLQGLLDGIGEGSGMGPTLDSPPPTWLLIALVPLGAALAAALGALVTRRAATSPVSELVRFE